MGLLEDLYNIFIKPIADTVGNIFKPITDLIDKDKISESAAESAKAFETALKGKSVGFIVRSPGIPEDMNEQAVAQLMPIEGAIMAQVSANILTESISLG